MSDAKIEISAKLVMTLRDRTNLPMMKCKQALEASKGEHTTEESWLSAAIENLRKQGLSAKDKFAGRETPNGSVGMALGSSNGQGAGVLVLLGCQTDFVSGNDNFKAFAAELAQLALTTGATSVETLKTHKLGALTVDEAVTAKIQLIGENIVLVKVEHLTGAQVVGYNHGGKIATLVSGTGNEKLRTIALHVASANPAPVALNRGQVDPELVQKEKDIISATPDVQAKPEAMRPKIVEGKLGRFFKENVLLEQEMLLDADKGESVEKYAARHGLTVTGFARLAV